MDTKLVIICFWGGIAFGETKEEKVYRLYFLTSYAVHSGHGQIIDLKATKFGGSVRNGSHGRVTADGREIRIDVWWWMMEFDGGKTEERTKVSETLYVCVYVCKHVHICTDINHSDHVFKLYGQPCSVVLQLMFLTLFLSCCLIRVWPFFNGGQERRVCCDFFLIFSEGG